VSTKSALEVAVVLAGTLAGPAAGLRDLLGGADGPDHAVLREAAGLIEEAATDPTGFVALHGDPVWHSLRLDAAARERLHRVFRRDDALEALYGADQSDRGPDTDGLSDQAAEMVDGVWSDLEALDRAIGVVTEGWRVERMAPVDRNLLRLGLWELQHQTEIPVAVVISEAVRLAKAYSTEHSGRFVNGVLAALASSVRPEE